jgi:putative ABC transport system permease protein
MTTLETGQPPSSPDVVMDRPPAGSAEHRATRMSRWRASWRVALRMARRDLRRHKGRAVLVFLMVAIPVGLIAGAATLGATEQTDSADLVTARMGSAQALLQGPSQSKVAQAPDPNRGGIDYGSDNTATPVPGFQYDDAQPATNAAAVARLVGGTAVPVMEVEVRWVTGDRRVRVSTLVTDPRAADLGDKARLTAGRWGTSAGEVVVTPAGRAKGLPATGEITLSSGGERRTATVVGTARALSEWGGQVDVVMPVLPPGAPVTGTGASWIIVDDQPVTWPDVQRLNTYGFTVSSRAVLQDPPPDSALAPEMRQQQSFTQDTGRMVAVIGGVMLFIITTLLVGPAFAVSASRQRRTLALAATNGAETRQLRRTVLAQAVVLGVISALGGTVLGVGGVRAGLWWWVHTHPSSNFASVGLDVPWAAFAILVPCAVLSAVVAALLPSLRLGRLDVIGVMRGQSVSPRLNKALPVVGLVVAVVGGLVVLSGAKPNIAGGDVKVALGAIGLVLGTLCLVPALLVLAGRLASRLPVAPRMATRDAARHRSRSTPTVAAILAGVTALTAFSIGLASDTKQQMATYQPTNLPGEGVVYTGDAETRLAVEAALRDDAGGLLQTPFLVVRPPEDIFAQGPGAAEQRLAFVSAVPSGCRAEDSIVMGGPDNQGCVRLGSQAYDGNGQIGALPAAEIARRLGLTDAQRKALEDGGVAVTVPGLTDQPALRIASGTFVMDQNTYTATKVKVDRTDEVPVVRVDRTRVPAGALPGQAGALVTPETAKRLGWVTQQESILLRDPSGAISRDTQKRLDEQVGDEGGLHVERGFQRYDETVMRVMMGAAAFLVLVVTLISTALAMAEQQTDQGTFAAVGATRRTRRALAASQSMLVGFLGAILGVAVGLVPGIAITYPLTVEHSWDPAAGMDTSRGPFLAIPWHPLLLVVLGVPLLAGLLSALAVRRAPAVTRRGA